MKLYSRWLSTGLLLASLILAQGNLQAAPPLKEQAIVRIAATLHDGTVEQGTGFIASQDGLVATAYHVIHGARKIDIFAGGKPHENVTVVAVRPLTDLALLRIPVQTAGTYYPLAASPSMGTPGDELYVQGMALGFPHQTLIGHRTQKGYLVSQLWTLGSKDSIFLSTNLRLLPIDITAEPGLSGGPVVDHSGNVVAVFSGSLRRGRGYSWAIPVDYLSLKDMTLLNSRAGQITWGQFRFIRAGLNFLRALAVPGTQQLWQRCRMQANKLSSNWEEFYTTMVQLNVPLMLYKPVFESTRRNLTRKNAKQHKLRLKTAFNTILESLVKTEPPNQAFQKSLSGMPAICFGEAMLRSLPAGTTPATYRNLLTSMRFGRRVDEINTHFTAVESEYQVLERRLTPIMEKLLDHSARLDQNLSDYNLVLELIEFRNTIEDVAKQATSIEQLRIIGHLVNSGLESAEFLQRVAIQTWEGKHLKYDQMERGFQATLTDGWLPFDTTLRQAVIRPGASMPQSVDAIYFGTIDDHLPRAIAKLSNKHTNSTPSTNASASQLVPYWQELDRQMNAYALRERLLLRDRKKTRAKLHGDLVLEITAASQVKGKNITVYVGQRFHNRKVAQISCSVLRTNLDNHKLCWKLIENIKFLN